jgi:DNA-binding transcriptional MerR regulator
MSKLRIGELAERAGVTPETVRYYEGRGLLRAPERDASRYRRYTAATLDELRFIREAQTLGFSLDEIGRMLDLLREGSTPCPPVMEIVQSRLEVIDDLIASLSAARDRLATAVATCGPGAGPCALDVKLLDGCLTADGPGCAGADRSCRA